MQLNARSFSEVTGYLYTLYKHTRKLEKKITSLYSFQCFQIIYTDAQREEMDQTWVFNIK